MPSPLLVRFVAGERGTWSIEAMTALRGDSLPPTPRIAVHEGDYVALAHGDIWALRGATSNTRYTNRSEVTELSARQPGLSRAEATCAALIPIRKSEAWRALAQDERRKIFEEQSQHIAIGLEYLPPIARRLHHCRELAEPFDFLTWFEYSPSNSNAFEELLGKLRATRE
jgi:hypothetical protein